MADGPRQHILLIGLAIVLATIFFVAAISERLGLWPPGLAYDQCYGFYDKVKGYSGPMTYDQMGCRPMLSLPSSTPTS